MKRTLTGLLGILALVCCLTAGAGASAASSAFGKLIPVSTGWLPEHETFLIWYAKQQGWDHQEGLDIRLVWFESGKDLIAGADTWNIGACSAFSILTEPHPEKVTIIGIGNDESLANAVMVRRDNPILKVKGFNDGYPNLYGHPADVKGKTVLCPAASSAQYLLTKWLSAYGLTPKDVRVVNTDAEQGLRDFVNGAGDAVVLWAPYSYSGDEHGLKVAATSRSVNARQPILLMADRAFAETNREAVAAFLRVYLRAVRMLREESVANLSESYKTFYKEWAGKDMTDAEVIKDITIHPVFTLDDQLRLFDASKGRSEIQTWLEAIIRFHEGPDAPQTKIDTLLDLVTDTFLKDVKRPIPDYR
uniref:ABC transporter substrate-binding protein n=1 Tax=uncultured Bilophila sp. TaxID=529385 RepID=UPI0025D81B20|nr:ABC transporter substrate-binding protein [uncultured Bilophila sp.]